MELSIKPADREVAIYWDYENTPLPPWYSICQAAKDIYNAVSKYGCVVERRVYFDYQKFNTIGGPHDYRGMDLSGFDMVNTTTRDSKETLGRKLMTDVLTFAWDSTQRNSRQKPCIVLLTSNGDYAYTLAKLRDRGVKNIVVFGKDCPVAQTLLDIADVSLSLEKDVLSSISTPQLSPHQLVPIVASPLGEVDTGAFANVFLKNLPKLTNENDLIRFLESDHTAPVHRVTLGESSPCSNWNCSFAQVKFVRSEDGARLINLAKRKSLLFRERVLTATIDQRIPPSNGVARSAQAVLNPYKNKTSSEESVGASDITGFCICLHNEQTSISNSCSTNLTLKYEKCWTPNSPFISVFRAALPQSQGRIGIKRWCRVIFEKAISRECITVARRKRGGNQEYVGVAWHKNRGLRDDLSTEIYLRLTTKGRQLVHKSFQSRYGDNLLNVTGVPLGSPNESASSDSDTVPGVNEYTCVRFTGLPPSTKINDFVKFVETSYYTPIRCGVITYQEVEPGRDFEPKSDVETIVEDRCWANLQFTTVRDMLKIVCLAITEKVIFLDREMKVCIDSSATLMMDTIEKGDPKLCYVNDMGTSNISESNSLLSYNSTSNDADLIPIIAGASNLCTHLHNLQKLQGNTELFPFDQCWVPYSAIGTSLQSSPRHIDVSKEMIKVIRDVTISNGLVEVARRSLSDNEGYISVSWFVNRGLDPDLSQEFFLRLTARGRSFYHMSIERGKSSHNPSNSRNEETVCLCLKNLPHSTHAIDLVQYLEVCLHTTVQRARIEHSASNFDSCNAHVEFIDAKDGARIIDKDTVLEYSNTRIYAYIDKNVPQKGLMVNNNPMLFYEKNDSAATGAADKKVRADDTTLHTVAFEENVTSDEMNKISTNSDYIKEDIGQINISRATNDLYSGIKHPVSGLKTSNMPQLDKNIPQKGLMVKHDPILFYEKNENSAPTEAVQKVRASKTSLHTVTFEKNITSDKMNTISTNSDCINENIGQNNIARADNDVYSDVTSNMLQLQKRLEAAVAAKDFQQALLVQNDIEKLEMLYHSCPNISAMESNLLLLEKELSKCISEADFTKADSVQNCIESLEKGINAHHKAQIQSKIAFLKKELDKAIAKKDFVEAGSLHERIEAMEKGDISI